MLNVIEKVADWLFGDVKRILIVAVLLVIGMAAQAEQSKYSIAAGRILAQQPGVDACASLHALRITYTGSQP